MSFARSIQPSWPHSITLRSSSTRKRRTDQPKLRIVPRGVLPEGCFSGKEHAHRIEIDRALDFRASRGLFFTYLVLGGIIHHALSHSEGVAQRSELCLQLNTVVFMRVIVLMRALMKCDPTLPYRDYREVLLSCVDCFFSLHNHHTSPLRAPFA